MRTFSAVFRSIAARVDRSVRDLPLGLKGLLVVAIPLAFLLLFGVAFLLVQRENQAAEGEVRQTLHVLSQIESIRATLEEARSGSYESARRELPPVLQQLEATVAGDPVRLARARRIARLATARLRPAGGHGTDSNGAAPDAVEGELTAARNAESQLFEARLAHSRGVWRTSYLLIAACIVCAPAGGILAMLLFTAGVSRRVGKLDRDARDIAEGRPIVPVEMGRDEIGRLEESLARAASLLAARESDLRRARDELGIRVHQRTAELARANETLDAVIQASPLAIVGLDLNSRVTSWNHAAERMFGWTEEEVRDKPLPTIPDEERAAFVASLSDPRAHGREGVDTRRRRKDGSSIETRMWTAPVLAGDTPRGSIAIFADFTERRQLEDQLAQAQKMEAIGRLAGGVAHDFNNLITIISGYGQMLLDAVRDDDLQREAAEEVLKASERSAGLAGQLLAFSRRQIIQPRLIDCNELVRNVEKMLRRVIGEDVELIAVLRPGLGHIKADPGQIEQVIMNLAVNSRDAMPGGGKLWIETSRVDLDEEYCRLHTGARPGPHFVLAVSDTGQGMNEETQQHIFEPFFTTKESGKGTGLGLSTVYGIIKQHGGNIWVYSEPGQGTTFRIYLPVAQEKEPRAEERAAAGGAFRGTERILLVEDDKTVRKLVRDVLGAQGYRIMEAEDGVAALSVYQENHGAIDLLITDVVMPKMGGRELAENLLALKPKLRVLYLSGYTDTVVLEHGVHQGATDFLQKPFTPGALSRKVRSVLDGVKNAGA